LKYVEWCNSCGKLHITNIGFSRKLNGMGYTSDRDSVPGTNSMKKVIMLQNLKIKTDKIDQVRTGYEQAKNLSCPSLLDIEKPEIGQDANPFVTNYDSFSTPIHQDISNVIGCGNDEMDANTEISLTRKNSSCPDMCFFDTNSHWTGYKDNIGNDLVQEQKVTNSEQLDEDNFINKNKYLCLFRTDLKNLVRRDYNGSVKSIPDLLDDFNRRYPGYKHVLETKELQQEAEKLNSWGWT